MKKKVMIIIISAAMVAVAAGATVGVVSLIDPKEQTSSETNDVQEIKLSWNFSYKREAWEAVVDSYNDKNTKNVRVVLDPQAGANYNEWIKNELLDNNSKTSIVLANGVSEYFSQNKFVNFNSYANTKNNYNNDQVWKTTMEDSAFVPTGINGETYYVNYETTATTWYYNKKIFSQYNLSTPKNWDELITLCETLKSHGITPLSISGDKESLVSWQIGWLLRLYSDQFLRNKEELILAQKGDYCYDKEAQEKFVLDYNDVNNDANPGYIVNPLRFMRLLKDGNIGPNTPEFRAMIGELMRLIPTYVPSNFLTMDTSDSQKEFIRGNAAMYIGLLEFGAGWERTITDAGVPEADKFDIGTFNNPPMTHELCSVNYVRSMGGASGSLGIINRNKRHNDAAIDFLKYFTSIEGQNIYYSKLAEINVAPSGPSLIKNVVMPDKWQGIFENISFNGLADKNHMTYFSRGFWEVAATTTLFVENMQDHLLKNALSDPFNLQKYINSYCEEMQDLFATQGINRKLGILGWNSSALDDVTKDPNPNK